MRLPVGRRTERKWSKLCAATASNPPHLRRNIPGRFGAANHRHDPAGLRVDKSQEHSQRFFAGPLGSVKPLDESLKLPDGWLPLPSL